MPSAGLHARAAARLLRRRLAPTIAFVAAGGALLFVGEGPDGRGDAASWMYLVAVVAPLVHGMGCVSDDFRSGTALLWLQKPGRPTGLYLGRLVEVVAAGAVWTVAVAGAGIVLGADPPAALAAHLPVALLTAATVATVAFAASAAGVRPEGLAVVLAVYGLGTLGADAVVAPDTFGRWGPVLATLRFPLIELQALHRWIAGAAGPPAGSAALRLLAYPATCAALGTWATAVRASRPIMGGRAT